MIFFLLILLIGIISGTKFTGFSRFNTEYLDKKMTTAVNGIFVVLVLFSHYTQYASFESAYDMPYLALRAHLSQMVVATFMFYSGYGMMEAIKHKGKEYVKKILRKTWQLLLKYDIAVLLYIIVNKALGIYYPPKETLLAFTTWTAIGNSNWYITAILFLYLIMYLSFNIGLRINTGQRGRIAGLALLFLLTIATMCFQMMIERPSYCYNTMLLLPIGCLYSEFKPQVEKVVMQKGGSFMVALGLASGMYVLAFMHRWSLGIAGYTAWGVTFLAMVLLLTTKLSIYNKTLEWIGRHIFGIYILQRLPMTVLEHFGYIEEHKYLSLVFVIVVTLAMASLFQKYTDRIVTAISR